MKKDKFQDNFLNSEQNAFVDFQTFSYQGDQSEDMNQILAITQSQMKSKEGNTDLAQMEIPFTAQNNLDKTNQRQQFQLIQELKQTIEQGSSNTRNNSKYRDSLLKKQNSPNRQQLQVKFAQDQFRQNQNYSNNDSSTVNQQQQPKNQAYQFDEIQSQQYNYNQNTQTFNDQISQNIQNLPQRKFRQNNYFYQEPNDTQSIQAKSPIDSLRKRQLTGDFNQDSDFSISLKKGTSKLINSQNDTLSIIKSIKDLRSQFSSRQYERSESGPFFYDFLNNLCLLTKKILSPGDKINQVDCSFQGIENAIQYIEAQQNNLQTQNTDDGIQKVQVLQILSSEFTWLKEKKKELESQQNFQNESNTTPKRGLLNNEKKKILTEDAQLNVFTNKDRFGASERVDQVNISPFNHHQTKKFQFQNTQSQQHTQSSQYSQSMSSNSPSVSHQFSPSKLQQNQQSRFSISSMLQRQYSITTNQSTPKQMECSKIAHKHYFHKNTALQIQTEGLSPRLNPSTNPNKSSQRSSISSHKASSIISGQVLTNNSLNKFLIGLQQPDDFQIQLERKSNAICPLTKNFQQTKTSKIKQMNLLKTQSPLSAQSLSPYSKSPLSSSSSSKKKFFQPSKNIANQIKYKEVQPFVDPNNRPKEHLDKIEKKQAYGQQYRDFLDIINFSNGIIQPFKIKMHVPIYKIGLNTQNDPQLIAQVVQKRWWWKFSDGRDNGCDFQLLWTDEKDYNFFKNMKSVKEICNENIVIAGDKQSSYEDQGIIKQSHYYGNQECQIESQLQKFIRDRDAQHIKQYLIENEKSFEGPLNLLSHQNSQEGCFISQSYKNLIILKNPIIYQIINQLQENQEFISKKNLINNIKFYYNQKYDSCEKAFNIIPKSFIITKNSDQGKTEWRNQKLYETSARKSDSSQKTLSSCLWIIKQQGRNSWRNYKITNEYSVIDQFIENFQNQHKQSYFIIQQYIPDPLLLVGRKISLQFFLLVTCYNDYVKGYLYDEGIVNMSSQNYQAEEFNNIYIHNTNINTQQYSQNENEFSQNNKIMFSYFKDYVNDQKQKGNFSQIDTNIIMQKIKKICQTVILSAYCKADKLQKQFAFQTFSIDFLIDELGQVWLNDVEPAPQYSQFDGYSLQKLALSLIDQTFQIAVDPLFPPPHFPISYLDQIPQKIYSENKFQLIFDQILSNITLIQNIK
ncbi:tubulin-tyrosine ligase family protein (macronuclear) [Tetrahymena thermophila SB210]|uniref:Tubulin-tyrosine ligase family protein n=1 Tax=Tetrahymena thermophila (strain SB210) TaxID=312017 RepID=Q24HQ5_TETTS|nr:tubulin-tyrosine ligase family protein [Tetrahymena thermophila SB210]EAS07308.2 tubulin-tyrosine ligase family protein [Tetrahymena thermophila SB210]|eukprot:XP_001027550.2 tubulin-tyrosine ligase family protein [Tetrahymena thermophila SB210]